MFRCHRVVNEPCRDGGRMTVYSPVLPGRPTAMQFGQLLTHLDTTQQMINNSLKDNGTLLTQVYRTGSPHRLIQHTGRQAACYSAGRSLKYSGYYGHNKSAVWPTAVVRIYLYKYKAAPLSKTISGINIFLGENTSYILKMYFHTEYNWCSETVKLHRMAVLSGPRWNQVLLGPDQHWSDIPFRFFNVTQRSSKKIVIKSLWKIYLPLLIRN